eukprot:m.157624 g.157624  ORF g.157624 m.157624 type:complete len:56 (-) comp17974_c1_seq1:76-243(-)
MPMCATVHCLRLSLPVFVSECTCVFATCRAHVPPLKWWVFRHATCVFTAYQPVPQ